MPAFRLRNPTEILFGQRQVAEIGHIIPPGTRVLFLFGGGSIKRNGAYEQAIAALSECHVVEFGGIEANPVYETILEAAELCRTEGVEFVLAVGGGSVVDAGKFLATIVSLHDVDAWDYLAAGNPARSVLPVGAILTLPATGSESNPVSVISHRSKQMKLPFANEDARPRFAVLDPNFMATLDRRQLENGVVDAFTHVVEQYLTIPANTPVQFGFSETLLRTLIEWGPRLVEKNDHEARETILWAANQALNGLIGAGVQQDWSTHMIGHAITAVCGLDHARTLTLVMPALLRYKSRDKQEMLLRYARNVWGIEEPDAASAAEEAITRTEEFFSRMGCPVRFAAIAPMEATPDAIVAHLEKAGQTALGERGDITPKDVRTILELAA
ncbi:iron-containing alcohol dehydrogenase [Bosea beijingensis]|uniref:iron-containing alcohol dehydrogenase n=1 Tax=Bosea beijingensis TaxID=3068632 RepID=UPI002740C56D|nr:iron-containing alcohol dehydrogenase [Bosea sp. REN20]